MHDSEIFAETGGEKSCRKKKDDEEEKIDEEATKTAVRKVSENHILYLNAFNFDFDQTSRISHVGHFNIFSPNSIGDKGSRWGFNTGIMRLNYSAGGDSVAVSPVRLEYMAISPLAPPVSQGDPYLKQLNRYTSKISRKDMSIYVQPLLRVFPLETRGKSAEIYAHLHAELLVSRYTATNSVSTLSSDTLRLDTLNRPRVIRTGLQNDVQTTKAFGYFGAGWTFNISPWEEGSFFFQPTIGITNDYPQSEIRDKQPASTANGFWQGFYLVRGYYTHRLSDNATIVIGADVRGILPVYTPKYATYVGFNLNISNILSQADDKK